MEDEEAERATLRPLELDARPTGPKDVDEEGEDEDEEEYDTDFNFDDLSEYYGDWSELHGQIKQVACCGILVLVLDFSGRVWALGRRR